jgi:hypothetical protein
MLEEVKIPLALASCGMCMREGKNPKKKKVCGDCEHQFSEKRTIDREVD